MDVIDANAEDVRFLQATRHGEVHDAGRARRGTSPASSTAAPTPSSSGCATANRSASPWSTKTCEVGRAPAPARRTSSATNSPTVSIATTCTTRPATLRGGVHGRTGGRRSARLDGARPPARAEDRRASRSSRSSSCSSCTASTTRCRCFSRRLPGSRPRFPASCASRRCAALALREAAQEYAEYYFLFPLFLSITLLTSAGFFDVMQSLIHAGNRDARPGARGVRAVSGQHVSLGHPRQQHRRRLRVARPARPRRCTSLQFFAMAQIAGYALGGCWTHIGCAQSVVAYAFIQRDVDARLHAGAVDQGDDAGHRPDPGRDGGAHLRRELRPEAVLSRQACRPALRLRTVDCRLLDCYPTWTRGRRSGSGSYCRSTSRVTGAVSPSPNARNFSRYVIGLPSVQPKYTCGICPVRSRM